jgi:hypothetical protein
MKVKTQTREAYIVEFPCAAAKSGGCNGGWKARRRWMSEAAAGDTRRWRRWTAGRRAVCGSVLAVDGE